jgi:rod shape determining protein RodA
MYSYQGDNFFFERQLIWIATAVGIMLLAMIPDYRFLRVGNATFGIYLFFLFLLVLVLLVGEVTLGAQSRFDLGFFSLQPSDPAKLVLIVVLAKYFSKRHELIGDFRHIIISGMYALLFFGLVFIQPDFGSAIILFFVWFGMVLVAGIKPKHLAVVFILGAVSFGGMWQFAFQDYQKTRIGTFLDPLSDIQGAGYNAYQSTVAVGSGQFIGKGIGYGTQSKLQYLPEYETDFIFAAFAEEWGLVGVLVLFLLFGVAIGRLLLHAVRADSNFERLFATGVAILFVSHFFVHIGMNIGLLPVTGTTVPFLSYGGTHLVTEFLGIGIVMAMSRYAKTQYESTNLAIVEE